MEEQTQNMVTYENKQGGKFRWVTVTTLLLAIGAILHMISPSIGGVTPNWTIAMYCLAIYLTRPTLLQSLGIGAVAAAINVFTSKAAFPHGNLLSEPLGALTCAIITHSTISLAFAGCDLKPGIIGLVSTLVSGMTFITVMKIALSLPMDVYLYALIPVVVTVAILNAAITQVLYFPAQKIFKTRGHE